jgi:predicted DNA-binding ribbon-helix-helix protein
LAAAAADWVGALARNIDPEASSRWRPAQRAYCVVGMRAMKSSIVKRSIVIAGHKTSVSLEHAFWNALKEIAAGRDMTLSDVVAATDSERRHGNLSSAIRLFVLDFYRSQLSQPTGDSRSGETDRRRRRF